MAEVQKNENILLTSYHEGLIFGLDAYFVEDNQPKPVILFVHGFNGFKDWGAWNVLANYYAQNGFVFVKFNLSHNGTSPEYPQEFVNLEAYGNDLFSTDLNDLSVVIDFLFGENCPFKVEMNLDDFSLIGHSRGGALVMLKAGEDTRVKKIATWASIISTSHFWIPEHIEQVKKNGVIYIFNGRTKQNLPLYLAYYEDVLKNPKRLNVEEKFKKLTIPILVAHGKADTSIPYQFAEKLKKWNQKVELYLLENANHTFGSAHPWEQKELPSDMQALAEKTLEFFKGN